MKNFKSHFIFNKQERSGIFFLLLIVLVLLVSHFFVKIFPYESESTIALNGLVAEEIENLKTLSAQKEASTFYPFNPNFISDAKGYALGMSPKELDRLYQFRSADKFVNSAKEFQEVTGISDSLLNYISPNFKFPEWTQKSDKQFSKNKNLVVRSRNKPHAHTEIRKDLNTATAEDLKKIYGIGEKLSNRIIKFRDRLGGFLVNEQLYDVYGLESEVVIRTLEKFTVLKQPEVQQININTASAEQISQLIYISYELAEDIVFYREDNNGITTFDELRNIDSFPSEKMERIALYLLL